MVKGPVDFQIFDKYERRRPDVDAAIGRLFLEGVSTRKLRRIAVELFGSEVSATTVSRTTGYLDEELKKYRTKTITDDYPFLFLDGITQKVREIGVKKKVMLCALGMKEDGSAYTGGKRRRDRLIPTPWPENSDTLTAKSDSLCS